MLLLVVVISMDMCTLWNILFYRAVYGALKHPSDFATFLLAIFIGNLMIYCSFYIFMKVCEKWRYLSKSYWTLLWTILLCQDVNTGRSLFCWLHCQKIYLCLYHMCRDCFNIYIFVKNFFPLIYELWHIGFQESIHRCLDMHCIYIYFVCVLVVEVQRKY